MKRNSMNWMKSLTLSIIALGSMSLAAQSREQKIRTMPPLQIEGIPAGKKVVAFAVNGKVALLSSGGVANVSWVNGKSEEAPVVRSRATLKSFEYVAFNVQFVRIATNYVVIVAYDPSLGSPAYLSRQIDDDRCPSTAPLNELGIDPNEGCEDGKLSPYMGEILGYVDLARITSDPNANSNRTVVLKKGVDF